MKLLEGKNVIITGASRGIGKGIAEVFAKHGANIAFTYRSSDEKAKALEDELSANGCKAKGYKSDASDFDAAQQLAKDVLNSERPENLDDIALEEYEILMEEIAYPFEEKAIEIHIKYTACVAGCI